MIKRLLSVMAAFAVVASLFLLPLSLHQSAGGTHKPPTRPVAATPTNPHPIFRIHVRAPVHRSVHRSVRAVVKVVRAYTVKGGDSLWSIAHGAHMSWQRLYQINRHVIGANPDLIHTGMRLLL